MGTNLLIAMRDFGEQQKTVVLDELRKNGAEIDNCYLAYTKMGVFQEYQKHPHINVVVVSEYLEERSPYTPQDLNDIDELKEDLRVIPIILDEHKGKEYVIALYSAAIYDALFASDGMYSMVAKMIASGRGKKAARTYYKIENTTPTGKRISSNPDSIHAGTEHIINGGPKEEIVDRTAYVLNKLSTGEFQAVLEKLPSEYIEVIQEDARFRDFFLGSKRVAEPRKRMVQKKPVEGEHETASIKRVESAGMLYKLLGVVKHIIPMLLLVVGMILILW